jgi:diguanylate cyclase (GGDEF)-like protein/PAS domain S-box-containing protein
LGIQPVKRLLRGIRLRLVGMILVAVVPLIGVRAAELYHERQHDIEAAGAKAHEIARHGAELYRDGIVEIKALLQMAAQFSEMIEASADSCSAVLQRIERTRRWPNGAWVFGPDGRVKCTTVPGGMGLSIAERADFARIVDKPEFFISDFFRGKIRPMPTSAAYLPVVDGDGKLRHVISLTLHLDWLSELAAKIGSGTDATVLLTDGTGAVMAHHPLRPERFGRNFRESPLMQRVLSTDEGWAEVEGLGGTRRIFGYVRVPGTNVHIAVGFDRAAVLSRIDGQIGQTGFLFILVMAIAIALSLSIADSIARPLKVLTVGAEAARRSPSAVLPAISGYREVVSLAASLNELIAERRRREDELTAARARAELAVEEARATHGRLLEAIEAVPVGLAFFDREERYVLWNSRYAEMYGGATLNKGMKFEDRLRLSAASGLHIDAAGRVEQWIAERLARFRSPSNCEEQRSSDDRWMRLEERRTADGHIAIRIDITDLKRREASVRLLFENNPLPMYVYDLETLRFLDVNEAAVSHYGYSREQFLSMTILDIRPPEDIERVKREALTPITDFSGRYSRHTKADGSIISILLYKTMLTYKGREAGLVAVTDITERQQAEERITHMAHHDGLTDLPNRTLFRSRLEKALTNRRSGIGIALHCIDLDYFKDVNDTLGHPTGDKLLRLIAERLRHSVREEDTVARLGGDEFAVIQENVTCAEEAALLAERLIARLSAPYHIDGHEVLVTASVGIATALQGEETSDQLLTYADIALYRAKTQGRRSHCFFEPEMDVELKARRALEIDLRSAFNHSAFELKYQPVVDLATSQVAGFEALLRWRHPVRGDVGPAEFIPLAEEIGLVVPLGAWVLRRGCIEAVNWPDHVTLSINLSPLQFKSGNIVETVQTALAESGLPPSRLELEITETVLLEDNDDNHSILHELRGLGVKIAMDDFGTGYSSLSYLRKFPFDKIKIDRSFVHELPHNLDCLTITRGIIDLANGLGIATTAEGVETIEQLHALLNNGCTQAQGFLFGAAKSAHELHDTLSRRYFLIGNAA